VYITRPIPKCDEKEDAYVVTYDYSTTLRYFNALEHLLNPFYCIWSDLSEDQQLKEYHFTVWVTQEELKNINTTIDEYSEDGMSSPYLLINSDIAKADWYGVVDEVIKTQKQRMSLQTVKPKALSKSKFKTTFSKSKEIIVKKIYNAFEGCNYGIKTLIDRLQTKYMVDASTAEAWVVEFRKYITIVATET